MLRANRGPGGGTIGTWTQCYNLAMREAHLLRVTRNMGVSGRALTAPMTAAAQLQPWGGVPRDGRWLNECEIANGHPKKNDCALVHLRQSNATQWQQRAV